MLVHVLGGSSDSTGQAGNAGNKAPAQVEGAPGQSREDLPVLPVQVPAVTPEADTYCPPLMSSLPLDLNGEPSRKVKSDSPFAYAWGDPAVVLRCGVDRPAGFVTGVSTIQINGVQWYVDTSHPDRIVWTSVDRPVYVEVTLPPSVDSAPVTALTTELSKALPYKEPTPGA